MKKRKHSLITQRIIICLGILFLLLTPVPISILTQEEKPHKSSLKPASYVTQKTRSNMIAIIIDDIGYDTAPIRSIVQMGIPVTFSILPNCPYSREAVEKAALNGLETILHLPMEPHGYPKKNPGKGALLTGMTKEEIIVTLEEHIDTLPGILGANNHMGSLFMESEEKLTIVFKELKRKNLFFVDSYTTSNSMGRAVAKKVGLVYASRDVFIDNSGQYRDTFKILADLIKKREQWHTLIVIGHPYESTLKAVRETIPLFQSKGIDIVPLSVLVKQIS
ncbi:MAG: divergent polysaccharide deacetylase family protein [Deltaproteobacteria bacterium]|nr:divergent polysaccharide deacetylase family protein [Deltaproteobacteria bacterium]